MACGMDGIMMPAAEPIDPPKRGGRLSTLTDRSAACCRLSSVRVWGAQVTKHGGGGWFWNFWRWLSCHWPRAEMRPGSRARDGAMMVPWLMCLRKWQCSDFKRAMITPLCWWRCASSYILLRQQATCTSWMQTMHCCGLVRFPLHATTSRASSVADGKSGSHTLRTYTIGNGGT
jgi:hypothetical protein